MKIIKRNKNLKKLLAMVCVLSCLNISTSYAELVENFNFKNITIEDGLSQSTIRSIYQDSKGYIWIGTEDGLNRYNGYEVKQYKHDTYDENSISSNYIGNIIEDKNGYIWVSHTNGLSRINTDTDEIKNYYSQKDNGNLIDSNVWTLLNTKDNRFIVFGNNGINIYDEENDTFTSIKVDKKYIKSQYIHAVEEDSSGHIWVGTDNGLAELDKNLNLVKYYNDTIGEVSAYNIYEDDKGNLWVCTLGNGLFRINLKDKTIKNYRYDESEFSIPSDNVRGIISDSNGRLWIGTDKGLCSFDYKNDNFISYSRNTSDSKDFINSSIISLFKDKSGIIWIGTYKGISVFNPNTNILHFKSDIHGNGLSGDSIYGIYKDDEDLLWIGTSQQGVNIINGKEVKHLNTENSDLLGDTIFDISGHKDKIFIATNNGLSILSKEGSSYTIKNYTDKDGLPSNVITSLFVDSKDNLLIGTNNGLAVLDTNNKLTDITYILKEMGVEDKFIGSIYEDNNRNYYIGCFLGGGLIKFNPDTQEYKVYTNDKDDENTISNDAITYINSDLDGNILVGTCYGLNILNPYKNTFKRYTEKDGISNNTIYGVLVDNDNNIWISTNGGISKVSAKYSKIENFTVNDGLQSNEFNGRSCFKDSKGNMYFGGVNGYNTFNPNKIKVSQFKSKVIVDKIDVNGVARNDISTSKLEYSENNIKVNFFTNDYTDIKTKGARYYYKLDGVSDTWYKTKNNSIELANLSPGNYTLRIKAKSHYGIMGDESIVKFSIAPPPWRSNFAICVYIFLICGFIIENRLKVKRLDKLVDEKTKDLRNEMEKNEELFNRVLILEQNKNNYFVNLSHELRTPLNVLTSINQLIKGLCTKETFVTPEKLSEHMDTMGRNTKRLLNLINNIIDNSKIDNNSYVLNKKDENIVYLVEETVFEMKNLIEEKGIELIFDTDTEEKIVTCGKTEIERCIINFVGNAVKFTPEGGTIEVVVTDLGNKVKISVKDTGVGISEENKKLIFDRFNQVVDENAEVQGGSGLGLTICKQLVELHDGEISVESEVGVGSEFIIILPAKNEPII